MMQIKLSIRLLCIVYSLVLCFPSTASLGSKLDNFTLMLATGGCYEELSVSGEPLPGGI